MRTLQTVTTDEGDEVPAGTRGTVVAIYAAGAAYEVEFEAGLATVGAAAIEAAEALRRVERLSIQQSKVKDYLLNVDHPAGYSKAKFFLARGFDKTQPEALANALARQAMRDWPGDELRVPGAVKHRITGPIACPDGSTPDILTVWKVDDGDTQARFVTARPARRRKAC